MAKRIINVAIAGQGRSGYDIHARWLREATDRYRIVAVADLMGVRRKEAVAAFGCKAYPNAEAMLAHDDVDLVVNALPNHLHPSFTPAALRSGRHVVCEKPAATRVADMDKMIAAAKKAKRVLAPFQNARFAPIFRKIQEVVDSGVLGELIHVRIARGGFSRRWDWQTRQDLDGGSLNNTGPHPLDQAVLLFGPKTPKVFAKLVSGPGSFGDADDFAAVTLYGPGSPTVEVLITAYAAYGTGPSFLVNGTQGGLTVRDGKVLWRHFTPSKAPRHRLMTGWSQQRGYCREKLPWVEKSWTPPKIDDSFQHNSRAFYTNVHDVLTGRDRLIVTPAQVRKQVAVLEAAHRQNRLKRKS
ncbi:MAG: Gfo/Idh/MocA family protein [Planctomycetota bacterium]